MVQNNEPNHPIIMRIRQECELFRIKTTRFPCAIYLGETEWIALKRASWQNSGCFTYDNLHPKFEGISIYLVKEETHLMCA